MAEETVKAPMLARDLDINEPIKLEVREDKLTRITFTASSDRPIERMSRRPCAWSA
jgi:hypothetical protein